MVLFALSFQGQVEKYGAYVGIAAFFGLAVLSLLYFSQARELKRLREWAGRGPERARELESRGGAEARARRTRPPAPRPPGAEPATAPPPPPGTDAPQTNGNVPAPEPVPPPAEHPGEPVEETV